jgi:hypothetical protein
VLATLRRYWLVTGAVLVVAGTVAIVPGWWRRIVWSATSALVDHWLVVVLLGLGFGIIATGTVATFRRRWSHLRTAHRCRSRDADARYSESEPADNLDNATGRHFRF